MIPPSGFFFLVPFSLCFPPPDSANRAAKSGIICQTGLFSILGTASFDIRPGTNELALNLSTCFHDLVRYRVFTAAFHPNFQNAASRWNLFIEVTPCSALESPSVIREIRSSSPVHLVCGPLSKITLGRQSFCFLKSLIVLSRKLFLAVGHQIA